MKAKIFGGLMIAALAISSIAMAQTSTPVIDHRQHNQERRINEGERTGALNRREANNLRKDERHISRQKQMYKADGRVTPGERRHLRHMENRTSRAIYRDKHHKDVR